jgi:hypothetical protein
VATQPTTPPAHAVPDGTAPSADRAPQLADARPTIPGDPTAGAADGEELVRLRAEVSTLRAHLDTSRRRASFVRGLRHGSAAVLIAITAFAMVTSIVGVWAATTVLNTDRWVATVAPLPRDPQVAAAVADYTTDQVFQAIDVAQRLRTVLPPQAAFIAGPIVGQLRDTVRKTVTNVLQSDGFQRIWSELNRRAHQRALAIIDGTSNVAVIRENRVDIDLLPLINQVLRELSTQLPTLFGKQISLPDLSSGAIPDNLRSQVQDTLGISLPANFAQFAVYDSGQLWAAQRAVATAKRDLVAFVVSTFLLLLLALLVSPGRRRTLLQLGLWLVIAAVAVGAAIRAVRGQLLMEVPSGIYRDGVAAAVTSVFGLLRTRGVQLIWIGAVLAAAMYLIGPGRGPRWLRRQIAAGALGVRRAGRAAGRAAVTNGPGWTAAHLDVLRVAGIVVAAALALLLSSWVSLLVIALALAAYELFVTVLGRRAERRSGPPGTGADLAASGPAAG